MIFRLAFVYEIGSTDRAKEHNGQKDCMRLAIFHPERDSGVFADTAGGWNKREINLGQVKFLCVFTEACTFSQENFNSWKIS